MSSKPTLLKCEILDKDLARRYDGPVVSFDAARARRLEAKGVVRILPQETVTSEGLTQAHNPPSSVLYLNRQSFLGNASLLKVAWVQDYSKDGGAELSNKTVVAIGETLGMDIVGITPTNFHQSVLADADIIIVNNVFEFDPEQMRRLRFFLYERRIPYVKYDHDYRELARVNLSQQMFWLSRMNFFISPAHMEQSRKALGVPDNCVALPLAIDTSMFHFTPSVERTLGGVLIPCYRKGKARIAEFIEKNPQYSYSIIGQADREFKDRRISHLGAGPIGIMPALYARHEFTLHLPEEHWAGERVYFESILCGCKPLIDEEKVGHASWKFAADDVRVELDKAPYTFWREVCRLLKN